MCDVCYGTPGRYPVIDRFGRQLYEIECPECRGTDDAPRDQPATTSSRALAYAERPGPR